MAIAEALKRGCPSPSPAGGRSPATQGSPRSGVVCAIDDESDAVEIAAPP